VKAILGLGNPGVRYKFSRHNLGFLVVDKLSKVNKIKLKQKKFHCLLGQGNFEAEGVILAKPLTFVNLSGEAALKIKRGKKIHLRNLLVVCDDINLPLGKVRIKASGSAGGHNGLRSIIKSLGSHDFPRLRIGVDKPGQNTREGKLTQHVLGKFFKKEI